MRLRKRVTDLECRINTLPSNFYQIADFSRRLCSIEMELHNLQSRYQETHRLLEREGYRIVDGVWIKPSEDTAEQLRVAKEHELK